MLYLLYFSIIKICYAYAQQEAFCSEYLKQAKTFCGTFTSTERHFILAKTVAYVIGSTCRNNRSSFNSDINGFSNKQTSTLIIRHRLLDTKHYNTSCCTLEVLDFVVIDVQTSSLCV